VIVTAVLVLALAAAVGFWAQRSLVGRRQHDDPLARIKGLPVNEPVIPVRTLAVFGLTLLIVHDLDRPYDGAARIEPTAMLDAARRIAALPGGDAAPPCDADGRSE
jgi:hypothetical protein